MLVCLRSKASGLVPLILPSIFVGIPLGAWIIRHVRADTFRRVCMSFDAWIVGFGMSRVLLELHFVQGSVAYLFLAVVVSIDTCLLYRFFTESKASSGPPELVAVTSTQ